MKKFFQISLAVVSAISGAFAIAFMIKDSWVRTKQRAQQELVQQQTVQDLQKQLTNLQKDAQDLAITNKQLEQNFNKVRFHEELSKHTYYYDSSDGQRPDSKNWGLTFTGVKTAGGIIAIDPVFWSAKLGLPYDKKWSQEKRARAPIFWKTCFVDLDNNKVYLPRDIGSGVIGSQVDEYCTKEQFERFKPLLFETNYRKFMAICFAP